MKRILHNINDYIVNFRIREEEKEGVNFFVIPIVALVEGVHSGSGGAGFYPAAEISRTAQNWNNMPLTINHPADRSGTPITANNPETLKKYAVGTFENVRYEGGKLVGEGWIIKERIQLVSAETLEMLEMGNKMEVSTGLFTGTDGVAGIWKGEAFEETLSDFVPDHLALLPHSEGACNFDAGCGVRTNKDLGCGKCLSKKGGGEADKMMTTPEELFKKITKQLEKVEDMPSFYNVLKQHFTLNEISHSKVREQLFKRVAEMDKPGTMHFLREVFDKTFIFEKVTNTDSQLFRLSYKLNKEDEILIGKGNPTEVKEKVEFITVNLSKEEIVDRAEQVDALIANEKLPYVEADREMLTNQEQESFDRVFTLNECECNEGEVDSAELVKANETLTEENTQLKEELKLNKKEEAELKDVDFSTLLANAKPEDRDAWNGMVKEKKERKDNAVQTILGADGNKFTEEQLQAMPFDNLENIISMSPVKANYSGSGSVIKKQAEPVKANERAKDGSGVPLPLEEKWNADGSPDFSNLNK